MVQADSLGNFILNNLAIGYTAIAVSEPGFAVQTLTFDCKRDTTIQILMSRYGELKQIVIEGSKSAIQTSRNKVVYNVASSIVATGGDALQAISQLPGVRVNNNEISIAGKGLTRVMLNGRLIELQGQDLVKYIRSISSNQLAKIELLTNPPAQYEVEGNAGLINIITRRSKRLGYTGNGQFAARNYFYGTSSAYDVRQFGELNASGNLAYNSKRWSIFGSINHVRDQHLEGFIFDLQYPTQYWQQSDTGLYTHNAITGIVGVDYKLKENFVIGASYSGGRDMYEGSDHVRNLISKLSGEADSLLASYATYSPVARPASVNVHAIWQLDTTGKQLSVNADYFNYYRTDKSHFETSSYDGTGTYKPGSNTRYFDTNVQDVLVYTLKTDFQLPTEFANYSIGGKLSFIGDYSNALYYRKLANSTLYYDDNLSNAFDYKENTQSIYGNVGKRLDTWNFEAGLRGEFTQTNGYSVTTNTMTVNKYFKLFPSVALNYQKDTAHSFSMSFSRRINRPSFWNLNPYKSLYTAQSFGEGNPYLQPEYSYNAEVSYNYKNRLTSSLFANKTDNGFIYITVASSDTALVYTRPLNFIETFRYGISEQASLQITNWWQSDALIRVYHTKAKSAIREVGNISSVGAYVSIQNTIQLNRKKNLSAAVNFWYQFREVDHIALADPYYKFDIGVKATSKNKKWDLALNVNDIFMTSALAYSYSVNNIPQKFTNFQLNRYLQLSVNYRFGKNTNTEVIQQSGNEDEKGRVH